MIELADVTEEEFRTYYHSLSEVLKSIRQPPLFQIVYL